MTKTNRLEKENAVRRLSAHALMEAQNSGDEEKVRVKSITYEYDNIKKEVQTAKNLWSQIGAAFDDMDELSEEITQIERDNKELKNENKKLKNQLQQLSAEAVKIDTMAIAEDFEKFINAIFKVNTIVIDDGVQDRSICFGSLMKQLLLKYLNKQDFEASEFGKISTILLGPMKSYNMNGNEKSQIENGPDSPNETIKMAPTTSPTKTFNVSPFGEIRKGKRPGSSLESKTSKKTKIIEDSSEKKKSRCYTTDYDSTPDEVISSLKSDPALQITYDFWTGCPIIDSKHNTTRKKYSRYFITVESLLKLYYARPWRAILKYRPNYRVFDADKIQSLPSEHIIKKLHLALDQLLINHIIAIFERYWWYEVPTEKTDPSRDPMDMEFFKKLYLSRHRRTSTVYHATSNTHTIIEEARQSGLWSEYSIADPAYIKSSPQLVAWLPQSYDLLDELISSIKINPGRFWYIFQPMSAPFFRENYQYWFPPNTDTIPQHQPEEANEPDELEWLSSIANSITGFTDKYDLKALKKEAEEQWAQGVEMLLSREIEEPECKYRLPKEVNDELKTRFPVPTLELTRCVYFDQNAKKVLDHPVSTSGLTRLPPIVQSELPEMYIKSPLPDDISDVQTKLHPVITTPKSKKEKKTTPLKDTPSKQK